MNALGKAGGPGDVAEPGSRGLQMRDERWSAELGRRQPRFQPLGWRDRGCRARHAPAGLPGRFAPDPVRPIATALRQSRPPPPDRCQVPIPGHASGRGADPPTGAPRAGLVRRAKVHAGARHPGSQVLVLQACRGSRSCADAFHIEPPPHGTEVQDIPLMPSIGRRQRMHFPQDAERPRLDLRPKERNDVEPHPPLMRTG
jgi:hypothetical protein